MKNLVVSCAAELMDANAHCGAASMEYDALNPRSPQLDTALSHFCVKLSVSVADLLIIELFGFTMCSK